MVDPAKLPPIQVGNRVEQIRLKINRDLGINDENAPIILAQPDFQASATVILQDELDIETAGEVDTVDTVSETNDLDKSETQQAKEQETVVNTTPTEKQQEKIQLFQGYYKTETNMLEDGSVEIKIKNSSAVIVYNNKGELVSAKNVTGIMIKRCLFADNIDAICGIYQLAPGEGEEKQDNFNKGLYDLTTDENGAITPIFKKEYEKPKETETGSDGQSSGSSSYSSSEQVVLINGKPVQPQDSAESQEETSTQASEEQETTQDVTMQEDSAKEETTEVQSPEVKEEQETDETQTAQSEAVEQTPETSVQEDKQEHEETPTETITLDSIPQQNLTFLKENGFIADDGWSIRHSEEDHNMLYIEFGETTIFVNCKLDESDNILEIVSWGGAGDIDQRALASCRRFSSASGVPLQELLTAKDEDGNNLYEIQFHTGSNKVTIKKNGKNPYVAVYNYDGASLEKGVNLSTEVASGALKGLLSQEQIDRMESEIKNSLSSMGLEYTKGAFTFEKVNYIFSTELTVTYTITNSDGQNVEYKRTFKKQGDGWVQK